MKILIVDDEPLVLRFATAVLKMAGHEILTAPTAIAAIGMWEQNSAAIQLVISDVSMPGMTGGELAECIRKSPKPVPVILMSGYTANSPAVVDLVQAGKLDAWQFLQKPFTAKQLRDLVAELEAQ